MTSIKATDTHLLQRGDGLPALGHPRHEGRRRRRVVILPRFLEELADPD